MPALKVRDVEASAPSTNIGLILGIAVSGVILIIVLAALFVPIFKQRRAARKKPAPSTLEEFMSKADRERVRDKSYRGHRNNDSMGPLLEDAPGRHLRIQPSDVPPLPDNAGNSYSYGYRREDEDEYEDHDLGPQIQTGPITYSHRLPPPGLQVSIPQSAPIRASKRAHQPRAARPPSPSSPDSDSDTESMYSQRSASTRMHTVDLASQPPPVPALPLHLRSSMVSSNEPPRVPLEPLDDDDDIHAPARPESLFPRLSLPPEAPPLARGDTVIVANLLKSRARRLAAADAPTRSLTRTERIERVDSIKEAPSPTDFDLEPSRPRRNRRPPMPAHTLSVDSLGSTPAHTLSIDSLASAPVHTLSIDSETLAYYTSQPINSPTRSPDDAMSVSSYDTVRPTKNAF